MKFVAIDLEMNQPSGKIIQIGAAAFDTELGVISYFGQHVDPGEKINWDHPILSGGTLEELLATNFRSEWESASTLPTAAALRLFWDWHKDQKVGKKFVQWGRGDMAQLLSESSGLGYPRNIRVFDVAMTYRWLWSPGSQTLGGKGLSSACWALGVKPPAEAHDALHDACATARLFCKMFKQIKLMQQLTRDLK